MSDWLDKKKRLTDMKLVDWHEKKKTDEKQEDWLTDKKQKDWLTRNKKTNKK